MYCPICGNILSDNMGYLRCNNCDWYPEKDDEDIWSYEHEEVLG